MIFAVYGSLKKGFWAHHLLDKPTVKSLGEFKTKPEFTMYSLGRFPAVVKKGDTQIHTELYETKDKNVIDSLYRLEGYKENSTNNLYNKEIIETPFGEASIFVAGNIDVDRYPKTDGLWR